ncbi:MAG: Unknown protein [uncultured Campylobacterales bacterium]|uniref:Uncharacterized protein n=1 Tax=uncultured Campylobacterales bacterium TaxID=352960 RepID=A0A6S6SC81_9BACT|nr:MAG: Unknown protein [uncultured Campylobacterales bacterium]
MKKFFIFPIIIYIFIIFLLPREKLYYLFEEKIGDKELVIVEEKISDIINLKTLNSVVYYQGDIKLATIEKIKFNTFLFYNSINIEGIKTLDIFRDLYGFDINTIRVKYLSIKPTSIDILIMTNIGRVVGSYDIKLKKLILELIPKTGYEVEDNIQKIFKETDEGYFYEI